MIDLERYLDLTDFQYRMMLSAYQNGFLAAHREPEYSHALHLIADGIFEWRSEGSLLAVLTPKAKTLLDEREREYRRNRK